uniref:Thymidine kinase n=1 Tax=Human herpesvirus 1 TaxID=10298 RepID=Q9ENS3_HHV1|nr:thymidine kinase [Human alphaherpesvirus 1]
MASYPCHQHASAFDQAARSRGHSNRRTALRPRRQQEATEVRLEQKMPTLLRVYIDGPHGMGKTTTTQLLVALGSRDDIVYVPEPMTYWQVLGASETIANIYTTQHRLDQGEISAGDAAVVMTSAQITMGMPYAAHDPISGTRYLPCFGPPSCWPPTATCITCLPGPWTSWPNASVPCTSLSWITTNRPPAAGTPCCNLPPGWSRPTSPPQAPYRRSATWRARLPGRWGRLTETRKETIPEGTRAMTAIKRQNKTHGCWVVCS